MPQLSGNVTVEGLGAPTTIRRDDYGIPSIEASNEPDAWFGMGYACAQDRLWQLEWYRRRGTGTWAELAGPVGVESDLLFRRLLLDEASRADVQAMSPETLAMFEAYAAGVNAYRDSGQPLPVEFALAETDFPTWEPWHSVLVFKVRHAVMGKRLTKLARTELLERIGLERYALLEGLEPAQLTMILPPGRGASAVPRQSGAEVAAIARSLGTLAIDEGGSNSWAVHGSRTTSGRPMLVNDSHRPLDVPNVYWQAVVACPDFRMAGAAFPGFPAFPHFGNNGDLAFNITHGQADYQDLYLERFDQSRPGRYRAEGGWRDARLLDRPVEVRGADPVPSEVWVTRHGPIVAGEPRQGQAVAMRYTATDQPSRQWECLRPMLTARTVWELHETQRRWVEPVNNIVSADRDGNIGYLTRGRVPVRESRAGRQFVVPGWTGGHEWIGDVPFEELPQSVNPSEGFIATANQQIIDGDEPYLAYEFSTPGRATRLVESLGGEAELTPEAIAALQGDTTSVQARAWAQYLSTRAPLEGDVERARRLLSEWDGDLTPDSAAALLHSCFIRALNRLLFEPIVGPETWAWITAPGNSGPEGLARRWSYHVGAQLDRAELNTVPASADGRSLAAVLTRVLPAALAEGWRAAQTVAGKPDPASWEWGAVHQVAANHTLSDSFPELAAELDPAAVPIGGDSDTIQAAGISLTAPVGAAHTFQVGGLSVYRQVVDFRDPEHASWVIPGGASGLPGGLHVADQVEHWRRHSRIPMHLTASDARQSATETLTLEPA